VIFNKRKNIFKVTSLHIQKKKITVPNINTLCGSNFHWELSVLTEV